MQYPEHMKGVLVVKIWAYFLENTSSLYSIDNTPLFREIKELGIEEDRVYVDDITKEQVALKKLEIISRGDTVLVRSISDLGASGVEMMAMLKQIAGKGAEVASMEEPWYDHEKSFPIVEGVVFILAGLAEKKRRLGMERAKAAGRLGRKTDMKKMEQVKRLSSVGLSAKEVCDLVGVSRSTYYRCKRKMKIFDL